MSKSGDKQRVRNEFEGLVRSVGVFSWATIGALILIFVGAYVLIEGRVIFAPLFLSLIVVFVLNPFVTALQRRGIHRLIGAAIGFLAFLALIVALGLIVIPSIADQASDFASEFPNLYDDLAEQVVSTGERFGLDASIWSYDEILDYLNDPDNQDTILSIIFGRIGSLTSGVFEFILVFLLGPVIAFYLLIDLPNVQQRMLDLVPQKSRAEFAYVGRRLNTAVGGFLRGQLLVAVIVGVMLSLGYWIIDLPFWLLIGLIGGVLNIVPFLGPWVGGILGVFVAMATTDLTTALWA
ncbi:MAG: AI-2E family transporter, partial [Acidimicrobiia bacterium]